MFSLTLFCAQFRQFHTIYYLFYLKCNFFSLASNASVASDTETASYIRQLRRRSSIHDTEETERCLLDDELEKISTSSVKTSELKSFCGVVQTRPEYYTIPPLEELEQYVDDEGVCLVEGFTVGRVGYGNVYFPDKFDVSDLNLDQIVHFRHKELTIYPDDSKKPPVGEGLNRRAQVTLDRIWPRNKEDGRLINKPDEIITLNFSENLRKVCDRMKSKFVEYRPDSGSWVFMVDHFSKYGLSDNDEILDGTDIPQQKHNDEAPLIAEEKEIAREQQKENSINVEDITEVIPINQVSNYLKFN